MKLLVTGGAGFIGSQLVRTLLETRPDDEVVVLDLLTYAGHRANLREVEDDPRLTFLEGDIRAGDAVSGAMVGVSAVLHLAAESHVDRSIAGAAPFVRTNVLGTQVLVDAAREAGVERFVHVSTDEVYGELPWQHPDDDGPRELFTEETPLAPRSPYAASKAASDHLVLAAHRTHGMDVVVTRCSNNYGPRQLPEKLIPLMTLNALEGRPLPVYGDGLNVRDWIHVEDHARGLVACLERGRAGEVYNLGGDTERTNLQVVEGILDATGGSADLVTFVEDRAGHDRRYAMAIGKAREALGWTPTWSFGEGLEATVAWYRENGAWCDEVRGGDYWAFYGERYE